MKISKIISTFILLLICSITSSAQNYLITDFGAVPDGISVNNFSINTLKPDPRPLFMAHDVNNLIIKGINAGNNVNVELPFFKKEVTNCKVEY